MAVFDANLMLRNTTQTISSTILSIAGVTGNWLTLGTGGAPWEGLTFRTVVATSAGSATDSMNLIFEFSDDQSAIPTTVTRTVTGTEAGSGTASGALIVPNGDILTRVAVKRTYVRLRVTVAGLGPNFGVVTCGVDAGDYAVAR